jgi:excisionase family DNA binding protein
MADRDDGAPPTDVMLANEVAQYLHIAKTTLYRLAKRREIPFFRIGLDLRFSREAIDNWISENANARLRRDLLAHDGMDTGERVQHEKKKGAGSRTRAVRWSLSRSGRLIIHPGIFYGQPRVVQQMSYIDKTSDLPAGAKITFAGIYVVSHRDPAHAPAHEVRIAFPMILPKCHICADVRFSLQRLPIQLIEDNEFFRD